MGKQCDVCGKKPHIGNQYVRSGKAKYLGGVGHHTHSCTKRKFSPNLQRMQVQVGGSVLTQRVCVQCLRSGLVVRPVKRRAFTMPTTF